MSPRLDALLALLVKEGHMTPYAALLIERALAEEASE